MTLEELQRIAGTRMSDAELIARYLDDCGSLRHSVAEVADMIKVCLDCLKLRRQP